MKNLILNSYWAPSPDGGPQFFSSIGPITYDDFSLNGHRTCSITMAANGENTAGNAYSLPVNVSGQTAITWGYVIRAIDADCITLTAHFHDKSGNCIEKAQCPVISRIICQFSRQMAEFRVPDGARIVFLGLSFSGRITACTFCSPMAYFS